MKDSEILFPYYSGNIYKSESLGDVTLEQFIFSIKNTKPKFKTLFNNIKKAKEENNVALKRTLKQKLYSFTVSVKIDKGANRKYDNIKGFTGLMQIDLDGIDTIEEAINIKQHVFENNKEIVCAFLSPSRLGVKCLMRTIVPKDIEHYQAIHKTMVDHFGEYGYLDEATKNAILPMFLSYDENILYRSFEETEEWSKVDYSMPKYVRLNEKPTTSNPIVADKNLTEKVIRIITNRFNSIFDNGHPQVRSTCLVLGSRVSAGYIDESEAIYLLEKNVNNNSYLQKNIRGYLKTGKWAIKEGMKSPKYF